VANLVAGNENETMVGTGGVWVWRLVLCWGLWQQSGFSCCEYVFVFNLLHKENAQVLYFNALCTMMTLQYIVLLFITKRFIPVDFDWFTVG
jgi:hypothetical protein